MLLKKIEKKREELSWDWFLSHIYIYIMQFDFFKVKFLVSPLYISNFVYIKLVISGFTDKYLLLLSLI
jgi:hypothetical protein